MSDAISLFFQAVLIVAVALVSSVVLVSTLNMLGQIAIGVTYGN